MKRVSKSLRILVGLGFALVGYDTLAAETTFCWKTTWGRGVGTIPSTCGPNQERNGLLCYDRCSDNYVSNRVDLCIQKCPRGARDDGLFCGWPSYKVAEYPIWDEGRCKNKHRDVGCRKIGLLWVQKCKPGYKHVLGFCEKKDINCGRLGLRNPRVANSCAKNVYTRPPKTANCGAGKEFDAGLCYKSCGSTADGVGPVCWGSCPSGWVNCGMGCAKDPGTCTESVVDQVTSVVDAAVSIALLVGTAGASAAGKKGVTAPIKKVAWQNIKNITKKDAMKAATSLKGWAFAKGVQAPTTFTKDFIGGFNLAQEIGKIEDDDKMTKIEKEHKITETALNYASFLDPTGIVAVVGSYTKPVCKDIMAGRTPANARSATEVVIDSIGANQQGAVAVAQQRVSDAQKTLAQGKDLLKRAKDPKQKAMFSQQLETANARLALAKQNLQLAKTLPSKVSKSAKALPSRVSEMRWIAVKTGQQIPKTTIVAGKHKSGRDLLVCRADMGDGIHAGKVWGGKCNVGWGRREIAKPKFDVFTAPTGNTEWVAVSAGQPLPSGAIVAGKHRSGPLLHVCRADMGDGIHPGKLWRGKCHVGWGGKEIVKPRYDVLVGRTP